MANEYVQLIPARDVASGTIQWTMVYKDHVGKSGSFPNVDLGNVGQVKFTYTIVDPNNLGISFDPTPVPNSQPPVPNALWLVAGSGTAKTPGIHSQQISNVMLKDVNKQLTFFDKNDNYDILTYQLNFVNRLNPAEKVTSIDPEIRNGGGGGFAEFVSGIDAVTLILSASVLALVALLWVGRRRNQKAPAQPS